MTNTSKITCTTGDCDADATHGATIYDGVSSYGQPAVYCDECASVLQRGGDHAWPLGTPDDGD